MAVLSDESASSIAFHKIFGVCLIGQGRGPRPRHDYVTAGIADQVRPFTIQQQQVEIFLASLEWLDNDPSDSGGSSTEDEVVPATAVVCSARLVATVQRRFFRSWRPPRECPCV